MNDSSVCLGARTLQVFLHGRAPGDEADRVAEHLAHCLDCRLTLDALRTTEATGRVRTPTLASEEVTTPGEEAVAPVAPSARVAAEAFPFLAAPQAPDELGWLGPYRVLRVLGEGGMGVVFEAEDPKLARRVALKVMRPAGAGQPVFRERFLREARASARLEHDNVVAVYQVDEDRNLLYLTMPLLRGETLEDRLKREPKPSIAEILRIGRETAEGLDAAHSGGLIHRDVKPSNVWLESGRGRVKILDFGLARVENDAGGLNLTREGLVMGTPAFMAPEQAQGKPLDARCDLFSLGCVLYLMCTGRNPFLSANAFSLLLAVTTEDPPPPDELDPDLPPALADLVMQLLAKDPEHRPATAREVADRLAAMERPDQTMVLSHAAAAPKPTRRSNGWAAAVAVLIVVIGGMAGAVWHFARQRTTQDGARPAESQGVPVVVDTEGAWVAPGKPGGPLSSLALVGRPAPLAGVRGWTVETRGHRGPVTAAACSPKARRLATAGADGTVRLWDLEGGKLERVLVGHDHEIRALAWSPDGKELASLGGGGAVDLWDAESGRLRQSLRVGPSRALAWSPAGGRLATAGLDHKIHFWDPQTGKQLHTLEGPGASARALAWSADGKSLAAAGSEQGVALWDAEKGKDLRFLGDPKEEVIALAWSGDGGVLAVGRADLSVRVWDLSGPDRLRQTLPAPPADAVRPAGPLGLAWAPKGRTLAVAHEGGVRLWQPDVDKTRPVATHGALVCWSADGRRLVTVGDEDEGARIWDAAAAAASPPLVAALPGYQLERLKAERWSPDGKHAALQGDRKVWIFRAETGRPEQVLHGPTRDITALAWSPDGRRVAVGDGRGRKVFVWDAATGKSVNLYTTPHADGEITALGWAPDGKTLAVGVDHPVEVALWDVDDGKAPALLKGEQTGAINALLWLGRKAVVAGSADGSGVIWNTETGKAARTVRPGMPAALRPVTALALSPDGKTFAAGIGQSFDHAARLFSLSGEKPIQNLRGPGVAAGELTWLPDGKTMGGLGEDGQLRFWDADAGQMTRTLPARPGQRYFLPERGVGASASSSFSVRYWGLDDSRPETAVVLLQQGLTSSWLSVSGDGHYQSAPGFESEVVYVVETDSGMKTLTPKEFADAHGWRNDPALVALPGMRK